MVTRHVQVWNTLESDYPNEGSNQEKLRFLINYATLAPSAWNSQPWKFRITAAAIDVFDDPDRAQNNRDPKGRERLISCGAAIYNLRLALRHYGFSDDTQYFPDDTEDRLLASIYWGHPRAEKSENGKKHDPLKEGKLFESITKRHSYRKPFTSKKIDEHYIAEMEEAADWFGAKFVPITCESTQTALAGMIAEGDRDLGSNVQTRKEYASWVRTSESKGDGVPGYAMGFSAVESLLAPITRRVFNYSDEDAHKDQGLTSAATLLGVIATEKDTPTEWVQSGEALQNVLLYAANNSIQASFLNQPIQVLELRHRLKQLLSIETWPQVVIRLGYTSEEAKPTPRRSLDDVVL